MSQSFTTASDKITKLVINSGHLVFENIHSKQDIETSAPTNGGKKTKCFHLLEQG